VAQRKGEITQRKKGDITHMKGRYFGGRRPSVERAGQEMERRQTVLYQRRGHPGVKKKQRRSKGNEVEAAGRKRGNQSRKD